MLPEVNRCLSPSTRGPEHQDRVADALHYHQSCYRTRRLGQGFSVYYHHSPVRQVLSLWMTCPRSHSLWQSLDLSPGSSEHRWP